MYMTIIFLHLKQFANIIKYITMKHKHSIMTLLLAGCLSISFISCIDEHDDEFAVVENEKKRLEEEIQKFEQIKEVSVSGEIGGYSYVDLGLPSGLKWATVNVGATKPTDFGSYFAWGETESKTKDEFLLLENYKWQDGESYTKYIKESKATKSDNKTVLDPEDDAVTANWGDKWRMPTAEEMQELIDGCSWKFNTNFINTGVAGIVGISKTNNNVIFLPAGGSKSIYDDNVPTGHYWSSTFGKNETSESHNAYNLYFNPYNVVILEVLRTYGRSVRAVAK